MVGERRLCKLIYLAVTGRFLDRFASLAIKGPSASGKSWAIERVLDFFPEEAYYLLTAMSERALAYGTEPLSHRFLVLFEAAGLESDFASYLVRSLLSEGCVRYETVEKGKDGELKARLVEREGPTGLIVSTTSVALHPENETRLLSLAATDTADQTKLVLSRLADDDLSEPDLARWHDLQVWLATAEHRVAIPYARTLADLVPPVAVRLRRDFRAVLSLIRSTRSCTRRPASATTAGKVIATIEDYAVVRELVVDIVSEGVEATVPATVRETGGGGRRLRGAALDRPAREPARPGQVGDLAALAERPRPRLREEPRGEEGASRRGSCSATRSPTTSRSCPRPSGSRSVAALQANQERSRACPSLDANARDLETSTTSKDSSPRSRRTMSPRASGGSCRVFTRASRKEHYDERATPMPPAWPRALTRPRSPGCARSAFASRSRAVRRRRIRDTAAAGRAAARRVRARAASGSVAAARGERGRGRRPASAGAAAGCLAGTCTCATRLLARAGVGQVTELESASMLDTLHPVALDEALARLARKDENGNWPTGADGQGGFPRHDRPTVSGAARAVRAARVRLLRGRAARPRVHLVPRLSQRHARDGRLLRARDAVWLQANPAREGMLCFDCVQKRLGRRLTRGDLQRAGQRLHLAGAPPELGVR